MSKRALIIGALVGLCLMLALAACQPGGGGSVVANPPANTPAPIHVPQGYQGMVVVTFTTATTYDQAVSLLESAGMKLQTQCPYIGPIRADPTPTPVNTQQTGFGSSHELTAIGIPKLTQAMLNQVASSAGVKSIDKVPMIECPLIR